MLLNLLAANFGWPERRRLIKSSSSSIIIIIIIICTVVFFFTAPKIEFGAKGHYSDTSGNNSDSFYLLKPVGAYNYCNHVYGLLEEKEAGLLTGSGSTLPTHLSSSACSSATFISRSFFVSMPLISSPDLLKSFVLVSLASGLSPPRPRSPRAGSVHAAVHKLSGIYSMWPDASFPLGARFPGDGAGGLGCVTFGWWVEEVKREEGEWGDDNQGQVREGMSFQSKKGVCGELKKETRWALTWGKTSDGFQRQKHLFSQYPVLFFCCSMLHICV